MQCNAMQCKGKGKQNGTILHSNFKQLTHSKNLLLAFLKLQ